MKPTRKTVAEMAEIAAMEGKTPEEMDAEFNQRMIELGAPDWVRMEPEIDEQHEIEIGEIDMQMIAENWENWLRPSLKLEHSREPRECVHRWRGGFSNGGTPSKSRPPQPGEFLLVNWAHSANVR